MEIYALLGIWMVLLALSLLGRGFQKLVDWMVDLIPSHPRR